MPNNNTIMGRLVPFQDGRMVFLAKYPDCVYIAFKSADDKDTKIKLSNEAFDALIGMANDPDVGTPERSFPLEKKKPAWRVVERTVP